MPKELTKHTGTYGGGANMLLNLAVKDGGQLTLSNLSSPNSQDQTYTYSADGSFINDEGTEKLKFVQEVNGNTYLWSRSYQSVPGLGQVASSEYKAEKLETNELSAEVKAAWQKRQGKAYVLVNEKYTSTLYNAAMPIIPIHTFNELPGYIYTNKIMGANQAVNQLQIPGLAGRDTMEFNFYEENGVEYVTAGGNVYAAQDIIKPIYAGRYSKTTIQANGHATWYSIPASAAGKEMTVKMSSNSAFAVYDQAGVGINHTVVSGKNEIVLPENGTIVFAGEAGSSFGIVLTTREN